MSSEQETPFSDKCAILSELWLDYRQDEQFKDFFEYNDLGLPLAYAVYTEMVEPKELSIRMISETFDVLLAGMGYEKDEGFETLADILNG